MVVFPTQGKLMLAAPLSASSLSNTSNHTCVLTLSALSKHRGCVRVCVCVCVCVKERERETG